MSDPGVKVPAVIIELRPGNQVANFGGGFLLDVEKAENHVGDLYSGVINIILHFHVVAGVAQQARESVSQDGVAKVPDVRGFIGIDAGVLDDSLGRDFPDFMRRGGVFG